MWGADADHCGSCCHTCHPQSAECNPRGAHPWRMRVFDADDGEVDNVLLRDKLRKRHARLTLQYTEVLEEMTGRNFAQEDLRSIRGLPATIRLANALYGKQYSVRAKK